MGHPAPAHVWEITKHNEATLRIETRWEDGRQIGEFWAEVDRAAPAFRIRKVKHPLAVLLDSQHFIIPNWDTNDTRGHQGPDYDVVFSRPGLAELTAERVWARYRATPGG